MVLGLFPGCVATGGVQSSGQLAWSALVGTTPALGTTARLCYGDRATALRHELHTPSRLRAISAALHLRGKADLVVVWHMDLLKLVPFVARRATKVIVFLHGVECWRKVSRIESWLL